MATDVNSIAVQATGCVQSKGSFSPFCETHDELGNPPWHRCRWVAVAEMLDQALSKKISSDIAEMARIMGSPSNDDELLASILRKLMEQYVDYDNGSRIPNTGPWVRVDGKVSITAEELAALERAEP